MRAAPWTCSCAGRTHARVHSAYGRQCWLILEPSPYRYARVAMISLRGARARLARQRPLLLFCRHWYHRGFGPEYNSSEPAQHLPSPYRRSAGRAEREHDDASWRDNAPYVWFPRREPPLRTTRRWLWVSIGGISVVLGIYYYRHLETVPVSGRRRFMNISASMETALAAQSFAQFLETVQGRILPQSHPSTLHVQAIVDRLLDAVPILFDTDGRVDKSQYKVFVVDDPQTANALVLPGGQIFVFTGILPIAANVDGLAVLLSHEISHKLLKHHLERLSLFSILIAFSGLFQILTGIPGPLNDILMNLGVLLPRSRATEVEADHVGLLLMAAACYDARQSIQFWQRMTRQSKRGGENGLPVEWLSTHPSHASRSQLLAEWQSQAESYRNKAGCHKHKDLFWHRFRNFA